MLYTILYCLAGSVNQVFITTVLAFSATLVITFLATRMGSKTFVGQLPEFNSQTDSFKSYMLNVQICSLMLIVLLKASSWLCF